MKDFTPGLALIILLSICILGDPAIHTAFAAEPPDTDDNVDLKDSDPHAAHNAMQEKSNRYQLSKKNYLVPDTTLIDMNGDVISLRESLGQDEPVILSFIFTSCTAICPVLTATLAQAQKQLVNEPVVPRIVSISIDPEFDSPDRLRSYAEAYNVGGDWNFLTGESKKIIEVQRAFDSYRGEKASHVPVTFLRAAGTDTWIRLDGLTTAADIVREFREITLH